MGVSNRSDVDERWEDVKRRFETEEWAGSFLSLFVTRKMLR